MNGFVQYVVTNSITAAVLAILVLVVTRVWRNPHLGHVLWLVVLVKLVVPPIVEIPLPAELLAESSQLAPRDGERPAERDVDTPPAERTAVSLVDDATAGPSTLPATLRSAPPATISNEAAAPSQSVAAPNNQRDQPDAAKVAPATWAIAAWLAGSILIALLVAWRAIRFGRAVREMLPASTSLQDAADELAARFQLRRSPEVRLTTAELTPLLWPGWRRPTVVLPARLAAELSVAELRTILAHELAHLHRRDHWVRWLEVVVTVLYWWHPAVWLARRELRRCEDVCCDACVVRMLPDSGRTYAEAMFRTVGVVSSVPRAAPILASGFGKSGTVKRRIELVLKQQMVRPLKPCVRGLLAAMAIGLLVVSAGLAQRENSANDEPATTDDRSESLPKHAVRRYGSTGIRGRLLDDETATTADGRLAATIEPNGTLAIWDVVANRRLISCKGNTPLDQYSGVQLAFSPDKTKVMVNGHRILYAWEIGTGRLLFETPEDQRNPITTAEFSPDGAWIAACRMDELQPVKEVHIWDADTGDEVFTAPFAGEIGEYVEAVTFSPDGKSIAVAMQGDAAASKIAVWDFGAGKQTTLIEGAHSERVTAMTFSTDGRRLYTGGWRSAPYQTAPGQKRWGREVSEMAAWDVATGKRLFQFKPPQNWEGKPRIGLSADGEELYSLHDREFARWHAVTGELKRVIDRDRLGPPIGSADEIITIHGAGSAPRRYNIDIRDEVLGDASRVPIEIAVLNDDGERLVTAGADKVHLWDAAGGTITHELEGALNVQAIAEVPSEGLILALTEFTDRQRMAIRSQIRAWERYAGGLQYAVRIEGRGRSLAVSPNGKWMAVISQADAGPNHDPFETAEASGLSVEVMDIVTGRRVASLSGPRGRQLQATALQFSPDSNAIASIAGPEFRLWDIQSRKVRKSFKLEQHSWVIPPGHPMAGAIKPTRFSAFAISPDLRWAVTTGVSDPRVFVWDVDKGAKHKVLTIDGMSGSKLAISPDSRLLAVSAVVKQNPLDSQRDDQDGSVITLWDIRQGRQLLSLTPDLSEIPNSISFSPDGKYLLSASGAKSAILWDLSEARGALE